MTNTDVSMESDLDVLCVNPGPSNRVTDGMSRVTDNPSDEPVLATVELLLEFRCCVIASYSSDTKVSLIIATLGNISEDSHDT